ncbi:GNAT family N-acetyltransferase [Halobacillus kuroshimensis]|uniref:GNAT family N-acetyltransferase n=1 Tax=Halobacillus kuroshimensis TaxID=302481 RepID=A0ABS3DU63_9BACI|nr:MULTISPECIES: GNAT family N-acetyltransferase [Halobacillus]MBN8234889.1 GNAT family N-acetyltransferase [Halobacillus kuroshimensis]
MKTATNFFMREITSEDWEAVHSYASISDVCRFQAWGPNSERETKLYIEQVLSDTSVEDPTRYVWGLADIEEGHLIGAAEMNILDKENEIGRISYVIHPGYWGRGIATQAAEQMISYGFQNLTLHRIEAVCDPRNAAAIRVLEKNGMEKEGRMRGHLKLDQGWRDSYLYSILVTDALYR